MANARGKVVDTTYLSVDQAEERGFIHRDYIAHCLRWTHFVKRMYAGKAYETARILDVGCGRELPLAKLLYSSKLIPKMYFGVDAGPIEDHACQIIDKTGKFPNNLWERQNILDITKEDVSIKYNETGSSFDLPNFVTCFEVLEHVEPAMMVAMLDHLRTITSDDCKYFFSTPCWNRTDCAANHVNEMLYDALGSVFERHGFVVEQVFGTFASIRDYEHLLDAGVNSQFGPPMELKLVFEKLRAYYDTNFLSCIFAPLFPAQSRNALWVLRKSEIFGGPPERNSERKFPMIHDIQKPWSSSAKSEDMAK
jgi:2-polyprenyl-3-methyl-5-hydroxy-6-metoxy-1,4-benzoquinol methylase